MPAKAAVANLKILTEKKTRSLGGLPTSRLSFSCALLRALHYYDGNGRTARLLTTFILHLGSYDLKGLALEEYYAQGLKDYYEALTVGPSYNYYMGRAEADITRWVSYFH